MSVVDLELPNGGRGGGCTHSKRGCSGKLPDGMEYKTTF